MKIRTMFVASAMLLTGLSMAFGPAEGVGVTACVPSGNPTHIYGLFGGAFVTINDGATGAALTIVDDGCTYDETNNAEGDGDNDVGFNGGAFPSYQYCLDAPAPNELDDVFTEIDNAYAMVYGMLPPDAQDAVDLVFGTAPGGAGAVEHHSPSNIHVHDAVGIGIAATAGTDGPAAAAANYATINTYYAGDFTDCIGNGGVSDDETTDPADCGGGVASKGTADAYPTVDKNTLVGDASCDKPADGLFWVFLATGPYWDSESGNPAAVDAPINDCDLSDAAHTPPDCVISYLGKAVSPGYVNPDDFTPRVETIGVSVPVTGTIDTDA